MGVAMDYATVSAANDKNDFTDRYNTKLTPAEERAFLEWANRTGKIRDLYDYDLRGAWKELQSGDMTADSRGHLGDKYKKPNHPTFSTQSKYSSSDTPGGTWGESNGVTTYTPSEYVVRRMGADNLKRYFSEVEPGVILNLKTEGK